LIDEFGTGTEPQLGGAIAEAILEKLNEKLAFGVITTHYSNLKLLARQGNGIVNGAMLFDTKAMQPLYQLSIGKPGSSFAFEIARKIGFPKIILKAAEKKTGIKQLDFDQQLQQLDIEKKELQAKQDEIKVADDFLAEMIKKYESLSTELKSKKSEILEKARKEAHELIKSSNKLIENTIKEIRESQAEKELTKQLRAKLIKKADLIKSKKQDDLEKTGLQKKGKPEKIKQKPEKTEKKRALKIGDFVKVIDQDVTGEVTDIREDDVIISFNSVKLKTTAEKLQKLSREETKVLTKSSYKSRYSGIMDGLNDKMANFKLQIDVRGKRGEEALSQVKQYIDDAILLNIKEVKILHGKGYGILRTLIHDYLKTVTEIKQFKDEHIERGGNGITIVILK
jgi:DNA mismatch repair protein MutS2